MKRKLLVAFTLSLLILMLCAGAQAKTRIDGGNCGVVDETHNGSNVKWSVYDDGSLVVSGYGEMEEHPEFFDREDLRESVTYVAIGDGVTNVGYYAFGYFANLEEVYLARTVAVVDHDAFRGCEKLHTINLSYLTTIGDFAFEDCDALKSITLPDTVTSIGDYAFAYCDALKSITLPDSETSIGDGLFMGCKALESVTIPESITEIAEDMFDNCTNLKNVNLPDSLKAISGGAFQACTSLEGIVIPDGVTTIGYWAFYGCTSLENVKLPADLTRIQGCAFRKCTALKSITIPSKVTLVEECVFAFCTSLESVVFPSGVKEINEECFNGCSSLKDVTLPADLTTIHKFAFLNTTALTQLTIPAGLESIKSSAFSNSGLKIFICTPDSVGYETAKEYCTYTDQNCSVYFGFGECGDNMSWKLLENGTLSLSGSGAMYDYHSAGILAPWYNLKNYISRIEFSLNPETMNPEITHIGSYAFYRLSGVTEAYLPKSLQSIGEACFRECSGLKHVNFGNPSLEAIPKSAFFRCYALESINLSKSCPVIENYAFSECSALKSLRLPEDLKTIGTCAFLGCAYLNDLKLTDVKEIGANAFAYCYGLESVELPEMAISIAADAFAGIQPTFVCYKHSAPYRHAKANGFPVDYLAALALPEDIKTVESRAFMGSDAGIIIIPEGCEEIKNFAFSNCDNLYKVIILGSETTIASGAFFGTSGFVIYAPAGSCADYFASANTIPFEVL